MFANPNLTSRTRALSIDFSNPDLEAAMQPDWKALENPIIEELKASTNVMRKALGVLPVSFTQANTRNALLINQKNPTEQTDTVSTYIDVPAALFDDSLEWVAFL